MNKKTEIIHVRIDSDVKKKVKDAAKKEKRTFSSQVAFVLEKFANLIEDDSRS
jgi:antitoxin component of RelBE/YafQ-DinJ toxin-antitoxin module